MFWFTFYFPKAAEAVNSKMTGDVPANYLGMKCSVQCCMKCRVSAFSFTSIGYLFIDLSSSVIEKIASRVALEVATRKVFKIKEFADTFLFLIYQGMFSPKFTENHQFYIPC